MNNQSMFAQEIKQVIDEENLQEATEDLKESIENDLEGDFNAEAFDDFQQKRETIMMAGVSSARNTISEAKDLQEEVDEREDETEFKDDRRRNTISNEDYNRIRKLVEKYRFLYTQFAAMFYGENQANDKIEKAVDLQRSRQMDKQQLDIIQEQLPKIIENSMQNALDFSAPEVDLEQIEDKVSEINQLEKRISSIEDKLDSIDESNSNEVESLKKDLENSNKQISKLKGAISDIQNKVRESDNSKTSNQTDFSGRGDTKGGNSNQDKEELKDKQRNKLRIAREENLTTQGLVEYFDTTKGLLAREARNIRDKGYNLPENLENAISGS